MVKGSNRLDAFSIPKIPQQNVHAELVEIRILLGSQDSSQAVIQDLWYPIKSMNIAQVQRLPLGMTLISDSFSCNV